MSLSRSVRRALDLHGATPRPTVPTVSEPLHAVQNTSSDDFSFKGIAPDDRAEVDRKAHV